MHLLILSVGGSGLRETHPVPVLKCGGFAEALPGTGCHMMWYWLTFGQLPTNWPYRQIQGTF